VLLIAATTHLVVHCTTAAAQDFLVSFDEFGYEDAPGDIEKPKERRLSSIPVFTTLNSPFAIRVRRFDGVYSIRGELRWLPNNLYEVDMRYEWVGPFVEPGRLTGMMLERNVSMSLDERQDLGGAASRTMAAKKSEEKQTKRTVALTVTKAPQFARDRRPTRDGSALEVLVMAHR
jgi:hypothetical protein